MTTTVIFVAAYDGPLPNWQTAFPRLRYLKRYAGSNAFLDEDVIFLDLTQLSADDAESLIKRSVAQTKPVIALSSQPSMEEAVRTMKLGTSGYGHSHASAFQLKEMAKAVQHGGLWVGHEMMKQVLGALSSVSQSSDPKSPGLYHSKVFSNLTDRELTVATRVSLGATNAEIAETLEIKERTVKAHVTTLFKKLNVRNRVELALLVNKGYKKSDSNTNRNNQPLL